MPLRTNRYLVVLVVLAVLLDLYLIGGTSSPTPLTFLIGLVYSATLAALPVSVWYAIDYRRRQR